MKSLFSYQFHANEVTMANVLNVKSEGFLTIKRVNGGLYDSAVLHAVSSGSIHVMGDLSITGKLTIIADHSATVLLPAKVTCGSLDLTSEYSSNINSNDLEVADTSKVTVLKAATASLYLKLSGPMTGSVTESSTVNTWINWPQGKKSIDMNADSTSIFSERGWNG
jgi:hypothetical protein